MEAKDTRILEGEVIFCNKDMDEQTEISFKAGSALSLEKQGLAYLEGKQMGIKEVVDWVKEHRFDSIHTSAFRVVESEWQSKLKEWGIG